MDSRGGVLRSYARLPLIPPTPFSHKGRRGSWGVLKPTTSEGTRGLPKGYSSFSAYERGRARPVQVHGCARLRRAYQQRLLQVRAPPARMRAGTPAHPGLDAIAPPGLPGAQRGLQPAVSAGGQDARAPRTRRHSPAGASRRSARASARSLRRRARRPHPIQVHGCARLRRAYQQRLLQVRAPPARMRAGRPRTQDSTP